MFSNVQFELFDIPPHHAVRQPPLGRDVVAASSLTTVNNIGYRADFKQIQTHLGDGHNHEDWHDSDHYRRQVCLLAGGGGHSGRPQEDLVVEDCQEKNGCHASRQQRVEDLWENSELNIIYISNMIVSEHVSDNVDLENYEIMTCIKKHGNAH